MRTIRGLQFDAQGGTPGLVGGTIGDGRLGFTIELDVTPPSVTDRTVAETLVAEADRRCPYSNAVRDNVEVSITVV